MLSYTQAVVIGLLQGVTELFPVSSLGHSVLVPAWLGGSWKRLVTEQSSGESPYLAFIVGLHVATALALLVYFRSDWVRILRGLARSITSRRIDPADTDARLGWLLVLGTIPVGLVGLVFEHSLRTLFAKPLAAAVFLTINGAVLLLGERLRSRPRPRLRERVGAGTGTGTGTDGDTMRQPRGEPLAALSVVNAVGIGSFQIAALFAGISRSGVTMVGGLLRGLSHEDAARFSFLLATPVILAAGVYKLPDLFGPNGTGIRGQVLVGSIVAGLAAYASVRFLSRYFATRTLRPFAVYCLVAGAMSVVWFGIVA